MALLERQTLQCLLDLSHRLYADHPALSYVNGTPMTYAGLYRAVQRVSDYLYAGGIRPGDRVAILSESQPNWAVAYFAITTMGAVVVPILPDFHINEIENILRHSGARVLFISRRLLGELQGHEFPSLKDVIRLEDFRSLTSGASADPAEGATAVPRPPVVIQEEDTAALVYTSGTTGDSKGVMLTHKNIVFDALATREVVYVSDHERVLSVLPLAHTYECTLGLVIPISAGSVVYYLEKPPTAAVLLPAMAKLRPTMMLTVPLIIEKIFRMRILPELTRNALSRALYRFPPTRRLLHRLAGRKLMKSFGGELHFFGIGGAALAPNVERFLYEARFPYVIGYGLTETSPLVATSGDKGPRYRSTGPALPGVEMKIASPNPETGEGEVCIRGPNVMKGYYNNADKTAEVLDNDGWFRSGDLGVFDREGYLFVKGRLKNTILGPSGENIYPEEIEAIINKFEFVEDSLVFGQAGRLVARVQLNYEYLKEHFGDLHLTAADMQKRAGELIQDLRAKVNAQLNVFSRISEIIEQVEPFEKTPTKKIKRYLYMTEPG